MRVSRRTGAAIGAMLLAWAGVAGVLIWNGWNGDDAEAGREAASSSGTDSSSSSGSGPRGPEGLPQFALRSPVRPLPVSVEFGKPRRQPAAGVLFDVDTGEVLWAKRETVPLAPASLSKLMTALLITERHRPSEKVQITARSTRARGSKVGVLPQGKKVPLEPLLAALIMASANDAALALALHDADSIDAFVRRMNAAAAERGLSCSHFSTPSGLVDRDNRACALDLAALAREALAEPRITRAARTRRAMPRFPVKGGRMHLANNHYFLQVGLRRVPGAAVTGLKTGYTGKAGRCYITTARLHSRHLGVVLLDSPDPFRQVPKLLRAGFAAPPAGD